jgi:hypothetical protein
MRIAESAQRFEKALAAMAAGTYTEAEYEVDWRVLADTVGRVQGPRSRELARMYRATLATGYRAYKQAGSLDLDALLAKGPQ